MKPTILIIIAGWISISNLSAQQKIGLLDIQLSQNIVKPGDSLFITVDYKDSNSKKPNNSLATLEIIIENEEGLRTDLRWPMINGRAAGAIYLPDSFPMGKYKLLTALQDRFFEVVGTIKDNGKTGSIKAMLLTKSGDWDEQKVPVASDGRFTINNWLFEDNAVLAFSPSDNSNRPLDIRISTQLDSSYKPLAVAGRAFYVGNPSSNEIRRLDQPVETSIETFSDQGTLLPAVVVTSTVNSRAEQFNEEYVSGMFRSGNERIISVMDDPSALGNTNIFNYLQGRVAGLQISPVGFNGGFARWRGSPVTFFLNEMRVAAQQVSVIPMADIAIVKAYPPPFFGAPGGGGAIAIYTRRGGEANFLPANRQVFKVRGYTPAATALEMKKFGM
jgi:hypothetical protein